MIQWIHPTFVHFPIALLFAALLFDVAGLLRTDEKMLFAGFWSGMLGAFTTLIAIGTGLLSQADLGAHSRFGDAMLGFHRAFAFVVGVAVVVLAAWRIAMRGYIRPRSRTLYLAASLFCASLVIITGGLGGWLVYGSGMGITPATARRIIEAQVGADNPLFVPKSPIAPAADGGSPDAN